MDLVFAQPPPNFLHSLSILIQNSQIQKMVSGQYPSPSLEEDGLSDASAAPPMYTPSADGEASGEMAGEPTAESFMPRLT